VGAEHAAVAVQLVDHHELEALEELGPLGVVGQDRLVQHVRVGDHDVTAGTHRLAGVPRGVAVEGVGPHPQLPGPVQLADLLDHVRCAAFELPFRSGEEFGGEKLEELLAYLQEQGVLHREGERWHWSDDSYPANSVSLRSVAEGNFVVVETTNGAKRIIAEVDFFSAPMTLYQGAIYMIQSDPYQVERLDWEGRKAYVKRVRVDYYTDAIDYNRLRILERFEGSEGERSAAAYGDVHLVRRIPGYKKIRYYSHENIGYGKINLPDQEMHTTAAWWQLAPDALDAAFPSRLQALDGFLGAAYVLHHVAALWLMSEPGDLGRAVGDGDSGWFATVGSGGRGQLRGADGQGVDPDGLERFQPTLFLYDNFPGGIGLSAPLYDAAAELVEDGLGLVQGCGCRYGCPACVGPILASDESRGHDPKKAALRVLELLQ